MIIVDYFSCQRSSDCMGADSTYSFDTLATKLDPLLDNAPASFDGLYFFYFYSSIFYVCFILKVHFYKSMQARTI